MNKIVRSRLWRSKWTDMAPVERDKHFEVIRVDSRPTPAAPGGSAELRSILSKRTRLLPIDQLRDEERWKPGWK